ncbi:hypothetical protein DCMF_10365 [Candidatus Formimonas warabiya]|uniref:4Fe-4S ferredoxin-type domain-containing protein n=2 Tax=Formimonas warabiya TaxID=1761012 RepID=A0A3G1L1K8_FORW1|nr:hypothetical protein DCMF_10365 [Candidatus Formimonas warabiya]
MEKKYIVHLTDRYCKACGICIGLCPKGVFTENYLGKAVIDHMDSCTGCKMCQFHCPDFCLEVAEA